MHSLIGRALTMRRIKPVCHCRQVFQSTWVFGAFSPIDGDSHVLEFPVCNSECFQIFINQLSEKNKDTFNIMVLDNGAFHKSARLNIPDNIVLVFLPPYSPELNPSEKIWWQWKRKFTNQLFDSLEKVSEFISETLKTLSTKSVQSICGYEYVFNCDIWSQLKR